MKRFYRCNKVPWRANSCPAAIYLLFHSNRPDVSLFRTDAEHDHSGQRTVQGIPETIRQKIIELFEDGKTFYF